MLAFLGKFVTFFGDGIYAVKFLPALVGALALLLTGVITKEMGGRKFAQLLAASAFLVVPAYLRAHHLFQPVFLNQFVWLLLTYLLVLLQ